MTRRHLFTSESVTEGHPDKLADQISDGVLDAIIAQDPDARVACESLLTTGLVLVAGEITTDCYVDIPKLARNILSEVGYTKSAYGIDAETCSVLTSITEQAGDIAQGVSQAGGELGAGDQGMMFGYATDETPELMPVTIQLAHRLARKLSEVRKNGTVKHLRPDGKTQVTIEFVDGVPKRADGIVVAAQHDPEVTKETLESEIKAKVIRPVVEEYTKKGYLPQSFLDSNTNYYINQTGSFVRGGPHADTGLTGRKIIVDTYGGAAPHGGGAFSGKDPTKVDRSAAYGARWAAKNVVAAGLAKKCQIQLAYCIGYHQPVSINVETFGTGKVDDATIEKIVRRTFDFSPAGLIRELKLRRPIYKQVAAYGHFGRADLDLPWESTAKAAELKK